MYVIHNTKLKKGDTMHIPDGYLGPETCVFFYMIMIPVWYKAFKMTSRYLRDKSIPMMGMLSAFVFLVMMFNWPVPDGTTAHMVGAVLVAILLGPWAAVVDVSVVLVIQAFFFGDGGLTSLAANCFNMAFVMPFTGYYVYRTLLRFLGKKNAKTLSLSAAISGYVGINIAAFCAAVEFGIQPYIAQSYCPYGVNLTIPAMMLAHLLVAGPVEAVVTGSVIYYLKTHSPHLLELPKVMAGGDKSGAMD